MHDFGPSRNRSGTPAHELRVRDPLRRATVPPPTLPTVPPERRKRIAYVVHKFPPESIGGTEVYTWSLARHMARAGHQVHIFYPAPHLPSGMDPIQREGVTLWRVPLPSDRMGEDPVRQYWHTFRDLGFERAFQEFLDHAQPEIVHFQHVQGVSARLIELAAPAYRLVTLHDYWYFCANSQLVRPDRTPCSGPNAICSNCVDCATERADLQWMRALRPLVALPFAYRNHYLRRMAEQVDLFIAPSRFLQRLYVEQGFPEDRLIVVENGLDEEKLLCPVDPPLPEPPVRPHFGFLGALAWQKGVHVLVQAFNRLGPEASLTIYGSETLFPDYVAEVKAQVEHPHVRFAGLVQPHQVGACLRQLDCLVVPSLWYENSPLVIQEAYGVGVPVLASDLGALPEKVRDGHTGRLFPPGDAEVLAQILAELVAEPERLQEMARHVTPGPSMAEHAAHLGAVYDAVATATPVPAAPRPRMVPLPVEMA